MTRILELLRELVLHNVLLKLVSIGIAFSLWFFVNAAQRDSEAEYPIPVRLVDAPERMMLVSPRVEEVQLLVSGPRTLIGRIEGSNLGVDIDLSRVRPGTTTFRLRPDSLPLPRGVTPIRLTPSEITLEFAKIGTKRIPVEFAVDGRPAGDLRITESKVTPEQVEISGPARVVREINAIKTRPLDLSSAKPGRIKREIAVDLVFDYVTVSSPKVHVELLLEEPLEEGKTDPIAIVVRNSAGEASVDPPQATLRVRGPRSKVQALELPNGAVYVDAQGLGPGLHRLRPLATLPAGIELVRELKEVKVKIIAIPPTLTATPLVRTPTRGATGDAATISTPPAAAAAGGDRVSEHGDAG